MADEPLELNESQAKLQDLVKANTYTTDQGTVLKMPDFNDPEVFKVFSEATHDAQAYFDRAQFYKHATTYRFDEKQQPENET